MTVIEGDCVEAMRAMDEASVDAVVCDPPYGLGFMGRAWDALPPGLPWAQECLRVLKPGGHVLAFGGTRTYHRLTCALEDAGFEIRDCIMWLYGSGFPKSLDVSKAIDAQAGAEREVVGERGQRFGLTQAAGWNETSTPRNGTVQDTVPATAEAERWQGWGTALKPAHEPVVMARKPLAGTVAATVLAHGTGALNVDGCRIGTTKDVPASANGTTGANGIYGAGWAKLDERSGMDPNTGRWPANVLLDPDAAAMLDEQTGELHSQDPVSRNGGRKPGWSPSGTDRPMLEGFRFVGIERESEYAEIARARIAWWAKRGTGVSTEAALRAGDNDDAMAAIGQSAFDLFGRAP